MRDGLERGSSAMRKCSNVIFMLLAAATVMLAAPSGQAQTISGSATIALKNGETSELGELYFVSNCKSLLQSTPQAEVLDGPPGVSVTVKEAMVLPRAQKCANRIPGGILMISAKDIQDQSYTPLTVRITYNTKDGERKRSQVFNLSLFP
jgi:hypothetical protein